MASSLRNDPDKGGGDSAGSTARIYVCTTCGKRYQRNAHLRRHEATHAASGKFRCIYCAKEFGRGDVCRNHMLNCKRKNADSVIPELRRGRKPKACEGCFTSKVSCDKGHPCSRCLLRHLLCRPRDVTDGAPRSASPKTRVLQRSSQATSGLCGRRISGGSVVPNVHTEESAVDPRAGSLPKDMANDHTIMEQIPDMSFFGSSGGQAHSNVPEALFVAPDLMEFYPWNCATMLEPARFNFDSVDDISMLSLDDDPLTPVPGFKPSFAEGIQDTSLLLVSALQDLHVELCTSDPTYQEPFRAPSVSAALSATNLKRYAETYFPPKGL